MPETETRTAYEAAVGWGQRIHAVLFATLPSRAERLDNVYKTACGHLVKGSGVYSTPFLSNRPAMKQCARCLRRVQERTHAQ